MLVQNDADLSERRIDIGFSKDIIFCIKSLRIHLTGIANTIMVRIETLDYKLIGLMFRKCLIEKGEIFLCRAIIRDL